MDGMTRQNKATANIGARLRELRKARGLSQEAVADRLGTKQTYVSRWERGDVRPTYEYLVRLADIYDTSLDHIVRDAVTAVAA